MFLQLHLLAPKQQSASALMLCVRTWEPFVSLTLKEQRVSGFRLCESPWGSLVTFTLLSQLLQ